MRYTSGQPELSARRPSTLAAGVWCETVEGSMWVWCETVEGNVALQATRNADARHTRATGERKVDTLQIRAACTRCPKAYNVDLLATRNADVKHPGQTAYGRSMTLGFGGFHGPKPYKLMFPPTANAIGGSR